MENFLLNYWWLVIPLSVELAAGAAAKAKILNAEAEAKFIESTGAAEANKIEAIGKATALAYQQQVDAMGGDNFAKFKITEEIGKNGIKIMPEILIQGSDNGTSGVNALVAVELMNSMKLGKDPNKIEILNKTDQKPKK